MRADLHTRVPGARGRAPWRLGVVAFALVAAGTAQAATEYGTVMSSTPVYAQVAIPQQQCTDTPEAVATPPSGVGALLGAVVGGLAGHGIGAGMGRAAATGVGVVAGAAVGNQIEANGTPAQSAMVRRCQTVTGYQQQVVGYDVVYDYGGVRYNARMQQDPGPRIALNVSPTGQQAQAAPPPIQQPVYVQAPQPVYVQPVAPVVVTPSVVIGARWGGGHWGPGYWR